VLDRPSDMFDREREWLALSRFVQDGTPGATLGVVSGRRRQGKTYLLDALAGTTGGFYFAATEGTAAESLRQIGAALTERLGTTVPIRPKDWHEVVDLLLALGDDGPLPVVIDEFPYLVQAEPSLPSIIQAALGPRRAERLRSRTRLLLCGSALSFMGGLLSASAPLRGRAGLELVVQPFDHRTAAEFWQLTDPGLAVRVHAVVGGTPAYRREFVRGDTPEDLGDFDDWIVRTVLDPASPLFREPRYLLTEEAASRNPGLYHAVLAAVASGSATRGAIASYLGRPATDINHPLTVLEDIGLLSREADAFRSNRSTYRITEPLITFYHAVMRPLWGQLERPGAAARVWGVSRSRFESQVLGPHFERLCRAWALSDAAGDRLLGGVVPATSAAGVVNDPDAHRTHEADVVVTGAGSGSESRAVLSIGEAKWGTVMGMAHLDRLRHLRTLIAASGRHDVSGARLACYSGAGFTPDLRAAAEAGEVDLIGLADLYRP